MRPQKNVTSKARMLTCDFYGCMGVYINFMTWCFHMSLHGCVSICLYACISFCVYETVEDILTYLCTGPDFKCAGVAMQEDHICKNMWHVYDTCLLCIALV